MTPRFDRFAFLFATFASAMVMACGSTSTGAGGAGGVASTSSNGGSSASAGGAGGAGGHGGASTTSSSSAGGGGTCGSCSLPSEKCCGGACVATYNDIDNCGDCGKKCTGQHPFCNNGKCGPIPGGTCGTPQNECNAVGSFCCGDKCCGSGALCCNIDSNVATMNPQCAEPVNGTCPIGCPGCP